MSDLISMTIKVPLEVRDVLVEAAKLSRDNPAFLAYLKNAVDEFQRPTLTTMIEQVLKRLDQFETRFEILEADLQELKEGVDTGPKPEWLVGSGMGQRLTDLGREELYRQVDRGLTDKQIAKRFGISTTAVATHRRRHDLEMLAKSSTAS